MKFPANNVMARRVAACLRLARLLLCVLAFSIVRRFVRRA